MHGQRNVKIFIRAYTAIIRILLASEVNFLSVMAKSCIF
jgi:hypothetical protein